MIKTKDGYVKLIGTIYLGNPNYLLKADGDAWAVHTNVNNEANKIVRTDDNGFLLTGLINTTSSNIGTSIINRIYCSNDGYIRYKTPEDFFSMLDNDENLISITVGSLNRKLTVDYANNATRLYLVNCYNGTTNNDLWSTIKTSNSYYKGTATIYEVYNDGGPTTYGEVLDIVSLHTNHWQPLLWFGSGKTGSIYYRNKDYDNNTWGNWRQLAFITDNVASATTVKVSQHTTNNTNYPLVWVNEPNTSSVNSDLYKSWSHLYYNPASRKLTSVGGINAGNSLLTTGTGDIYLEWYRGTNASWRILNTSGTLKFQCNYTTGVSTYYDVLNLSYNTGNASLKGDFTLGGLILRIGKGSSWVKGRDYAVIRMNTSSGYSPIWSAKTTNGSWDCGTYTENRLHFSYITDSNYNSNTNTQSANIYFNPNGLIGVNGIISTSTIRIKCTTGNYQEGLTIQNADSKWCTIRLGNTEDSGTTENTWSIHRTSSNNFSISRNSSNGANGLTINKSGNIGIGYADTSIPGYRLALNGTLYTTGNHYYLFNGDSTLRIYGETSGNDEGVNLLVGIDGRFDNYTISSYGGESRHPLILNPRGGYVGIGIRPSHKLHVNGNTYTTGYVSGNTLTSRVATGTAPLTVTSTTKVNNLNADLLDGVHEASLTRFVLSPCTGGMPAESAKSYFSNSAIAGRVTTVYNVPGSEKTAIFGKSTGNYGHILMWGYDDTYLRILRFYAGTWKSSDWEKISAGNADRLTTARTIWGKSFDGTANISGDMTGVHHIYHNGYFIYTGLSGKNINTIDYYGGGSVTFGYGQAGNNIDSHLEGRNIYFHTSSGHNIRMTISEVGNVGIGTSSPSQKLHVNGNVLANSFIKSGSSNSYVLLGGGGSKNLSDFALSSHTHPYLPLSGGTMQSGATVIFPHNGYIIQNSISTSNYTSIVEWRKGGVSQAKYDPQIGQHNTGGDGTGSITILPYPTETDPWSGSVGLYISKNTLKINNETVLHTGNYTSTLDSRYVNVSGDTMTGPLTVNRLALGYGANEINSTDFVFLGYRNTPNGVNVCYNNKPFTYGSSQYTVWHAGNGGHGSGLDADKLDGKHASSFALSSHTHSYLPLAGGTMNSGARISHNGSLYIGSSSNSGYVYVLDIASQNGTSYWLISLGGSASFKDYVTSKGFKKSGYSDSYVLLAGGGAKALSSFITGNAGSSTQGVYVTGGTVKAMTYKLNATVGSGSPSRLAYYSGTNSIDDYSSSVGSSTKFMYLSSGVPKASSSTVGSSITPVYLSSGSIVAGKTITDYYWANIRISISSSTTTFPTFGTLAVTDLSVLGGLMIHLKSITPSSSYTVLPNDCLLLVSDWSSTVHIYFPKYSSNKGRILIVKNTVGSKVYIHGEEFIFCRGDKGSGNFYFNDNHSRIFVASSKGWIEFWCSIPE